MKKTLAIILSLFALAALLSGCDSGNTVTFDTVGGDPVPSIIVSEDEGFIFPETPVKEGYIFVSWYSDAELTTNFDPEVLIEEDTTLYAKWSPKVRKVFLMNDETILTGFYIDYAEEIELPTTVDIIGYSFEGWYLDSTFETSVESITGTLEDYTIYAKFVEVDFVVPTEGTIDLTSLPYYSYLSETNPVVTITVEGIGAITLELFPDVAPNTVNNFISYITTEAYTDSTFHRVINNFMIQGGKVETNTCAISGDFSSNGFENDLSHYRGVLSVARTSVMDSGTSQFFILHADQAGLDGNYATFGGVTSGFNVLDFIAVITTNDSDKPIRDIVIESITIELNGYVPSAPVCAE